MSRPFMFLLAAALIFGISLGGAFAGGVLAGLVLGGLFLQFLLQDLFGITAQ